MTSPTNGARHATVEVEQNVLGALLAQPSTWTEVRQHLREDHFGRPGHAVIYRAIRDLHANGVDVDALTVAEHLKRGGEIEQAGGIGYITRLSRETLAPEHIMAHAEVLISDARRRQLAELGNELTDSAATPAELLERIGRTQAAMSQVSQVSQPVPLVRKVPAPAPYPIDALGPILAPAARAIAELVQVPEALAGNSVLAAAALAAQKHANVQTLGGARPISLYMLTVAESGERKTTADAVATLPAKDWAKQLQVKYRKDVREHEAGIEAHKMQARKVKESASDADALKRGLLALREEQAPRKPFMLVSEPTAEGLILSLKDGQLSQGLFNDEGGAFVGGHALSQEAELRTIAMLSRAWEGAALDRVRAKDHEHVTLYGRRLSLHLLCQPEVANRLLGKSLYRSQGFLARFLIAAPESLIGRRVHSGHAKQARDDTRVDRYWSALAALLDRHAPEDEEVGGLSPPCLALSPAARRLLVDSYNAIEAEQAGDGELSTVREFASKAAEHAARIAAVLALVSDPEASAISEQDMQAGLKLVEFYANEQVRLIGSASVSPEIDNAQKLVDWIARKDLRTLTARDVMWRGPNSIRDAEAAKAALRMAQTHGWLTTEDGRTYTVPSSAVAAMREAKCSN